MAQPLGRYFPKIIQRQLTFDDDDDAVGVAARRDAGVLAGVALLHVK